MKTGIRRTALGVLATLALAAAGAGYLAPAPYDRQFREEPNAPCSRRFPLGTDELGRDRLSRLLYGARVSLLLAPSAALLATVAAALAGGAAGWLGGWTDRALMSGANLVLAMPWMFLLIAVRAALPLNVDPGVSLAVTVVLLGGLGWVPAARALRAGMLRLVRSDFLLQARAAGCGTARLFFVHALPNTKGLLAAQFWTAVPLFLLAEANLSLLGLGVAEPMPSLGNLLRELESFHHVRSQPVVLAPLVVLVALVTCCQLAFPAREEGMR
ncbi:MAG: ABC transporter permease [Bryobacterales bacterium]|nr:ABC transporter permease [Bryobacterales bacterium]